MAKSDVKLLGSRYSPFVNRVRMALEVKSIEYEIVDINPYIKPEILIKYNPVHKKIPVLIHGDRPICESLIILQYIDDAWTNGPSLLPLDPYERSVARFWATFVDDKYIPLLGKIKAAQGKEAKESFLEEIYKVLLSLEEAFINCSKGKAFFGGDNVGYLDLALGSFVGSTKVFEIEIGVKIFDETKTPSLVKWTERLYSDSLVKDLMPDPQNSEVSRTFQEVRSHYAESFFWLRVCLYCCYFLHLSFLSDYPL